MDTADAVVIGSGPNGLIAAAELARSGWSVVVLERAPVAGGAIRSEALTLPGFVHDTYSAFYGLLHASPVFERFDLARRVAWASFEAPVAAVVEPHRAATIAGAASETAKALETIAAGDGPAWESLYEWWWRAGRRLFAAMLAPFPAAGPGTRFLRAAGIRGAIEATRMQVEPLEAVASRLLASEEARALLACGVTHTDLAVDAAGSTPGSLILAMLAQQVGMPVPVGGAGRLAEALAGLVTAERGAIATGREAVRVVVEGGRAVAVETAGGEVFRARRAVVADTGPLRLFRDMVGQDHVPSTYLDGLRAFRYGSGVFKVDLALDGPVPWAAPGLDRTGVVHLCGTLDRMARSAFEVRRGLLPEQPLMICGQQTVADVSRAPEGKHTLWVEMHVPPAPRGDGAGAIADLDWPRAQEPFLERVLDRLEAHAPGVRSLVAGVSVKTPVHLERENPNLVGGDLGGGSSSLDQQLVFRPVPGWFRYRTPVKGLYLCSASTHPGGGVHGMGGLNCARRMKRDGRMGRLGTRR